LLGVRQLDRHARLEPAGVHVGVGLEEVLIIAGVAVDAEGDRGEGLAGLDLVSARARRGAGGRLGGAGGIGLANVGAAGNAARGGGAAAAGGSRGAVGAAGVAPRVGRSAGHQRRAGGRVLAEHRVPLAAGLGTAAAGGRLTDPFAACGSAGIAVARAGFGLARLAGITRQVAAAGVIAGAGGR